MNTIQTTLPFFGIIKATGDDAASFLHNQLSNDITGLPINGACFASYNTPQGRVIANILVLKTENAIYLAMAKDLCESVTKRLKMYILRSKVTLEETANFFISAQLPEKFETTPYTTSLPVTSLEGDFWKIDLPYGGYYLFGGANTPTKPSENTEQINLWQKHEIDNGQAWINLKTTEKFVAQMLNLHTTGAVHFKKGCYPGQEIIARAQYRGQVRRGLVILRTSEKFEAGEQLFDQNNEEIGSILNSSGDRQGEFEALCVIKFSAAANPILVHDSPQILIKQFFENTQ